MLRNVYLVDIFLPNEVAFRGIRVTECVHTEQCKFGVLIGMDVICSGDFAITNVNGKTTFTYRHPSIMEIDFVEETKRHNEEIDRRNAVQTRKNAQQVRKQKKPYYKGLKR